MKTLRLGDLPPTHATLAQAQYRAVVRWSLMPRRLKPCTAWLRAEQRLLR